jgi:hypothetical protein
VLSCRSEETGAELRALTSRSSHEHVHLEPLDAASTGSLIAAILGAKKVSAEFTSYLWDRTGGLPLAVEEVLALMRERGLLMHQEHGWARKSLTELEVPRGIRDQTMDRVARLPEPAQRIVEAAAVLQRPAALDVLTATAGETVDPASATTGMRFQLTAALNQAGADVDRQRRLLLDAVPDLHERPELLARSMVALGVQLEDAVASLQPLVDMIDAKGVWALACWGLPAAVELWSAVGEEERARTFLDRAETALRLLGSRARGRPGAAVRRAACSQAVWWTTELRG